MKYYFKILFLAIGFLAAFSCNNDKGMYGNTTSPSIAERLKAERSTNESIEKRIDDLLGQMTLEEKNSMSHRARAFLKFADYFKFNG